MRTVSRRAARRAPAKHGEVYVYAFDLGFALVCVTGLAIAVAFGVVGFTGDRTDFAATVFPFALTSRAASV